MPRNLDPLDRVQIATPCPASWSAMTGGERVRHCELCHKNVYNISEMSRDEALSLIREKEGRLCLRLARRTDGTVLTKDCPVGVRAMRRRLAYALSFALAMFVSLRAYALRPVAEELSPDDARKTVQEARAFRDRQIRPICAFLDWVDPISDPTAPQPVFYAGAMSGPPVTQGNVGIQQVTTKN
jgi:hypothetical protein